MSRSIWIGLMAFFLLSNCRQSFQHAKAIRRLEKLPRHASYTCPSCTSSPPAGPFWRCDTCSQPFDVFATDGTCPNCSGIKAAAPCVDCGTVSPVAAWRRGGVDVAT